MKQFATIIFVSIALHSPTWAASTECSSALWTVDGRICNEAESPQAEIDLTQSYHQKLEEISRSHAEWMQVSRAQLGKIGNSLDFANLQRAWSNRLQSTCQSDVVCIKLTYEKQIKRVKSIDALELSRLNAANWAMHLNAIVSDYSKFLETSAQHQLLADTDATTQTAENNCKSNYSDESDQYNCMLRFYLRQTITVAMQLTDRLSKLREEIRIHADQIDRKQSYVYFQYLEPQEGHLTALLLFPATNASSRKLDFYFNGLQEVWFSEQKFEQVATLLLKQKSAMAGISSDCDAHHNFGTFEISVVSAQGISGYCENVSEANKLVSEIETMTADTNDQEAGAFLKSMMPGSG